MVKPEIESGYPEKRDELFAILPACSPCCVTQPKITSSIEFRFKKFFCSMSLYKISNNSYGLSLLRLPLSLARALGVLVESTMKTGFMELFS